MKKLLFILFLYSSANAQTCVPISNLQILEDTVAHQLQLNWLRSDRQMVTQVFLNNTVYVNGWCNYSLVFGSGSQVIECTVFPLSKGDVLQINVREYCTYPIGIDYSDSFTTYQVQNNICGSTPLNLKRKKR